MSAEIVNLDRGWEQLLIRGREGPKPIIANVITALQKSPDWADRLYFDEFHRRTIVSGVMPWTDGYEIQESWTDMHDTRCAQWMQQMGILVSPEMVGRAVELVAQDNPFHPVKDYFESIVWDPSKGEPCLTWLSDYLGVEKTTYTIAVGMCWLISAVARIYQPGCKADAALILIGPQGIKKSTALKIIGGEFFTDEIADLGTKDSAVQLAGAHIIELSELDSMGRGDMSKIKAFMSRTVDRYRPPYGRRVIEQPRECVFSGTTNNDQPFKDETGARRFWLVRCDKEIDIEGLTAARDQIWANAVFHYHKGTKWWLPVYALDQAEEAQRDGYEHDVWETTIEDWLRGYNRTTVVKILTECLSIPSKDQHQILQNRVARALRMLGWKKHRITEAGTRPWGYVRIAEDQTKRPTLDEFIVGHSEPSEVGQEDDFGYRSDFD